MPIVPPKEIRVIGGRIYRAGQEYSEKIIEVDKSVFEKKDPAPEARKTKDKPIKEGEK